jgi:hypothetical protein
VPPDDLERHPDLTATGASMRAVWREEQEAATRDAAEAWQHRETLDDRLRAHMHRGDRLTATVLRRRFTGIVEEVGRDLVALQTASGRVDIHLTTSVSIEFAVSARAREGGHRGSNAAGGSFRQALVGRERDGNILLGSGDFPDGRRGEVRVGADHVRLLTPDAEVIVPLSAVGWVCRAPD